MSRSVMEFVTGDWGWVVIRGGVEERMGVGLRRSENATKLSMYGGMCTCTYVCMYVRTYVRMSECMLECMHVCIPYECRHVFVGM